MADAPKTHRIKLDNGHSEDVTEQELAAIKARTGRNFSLYEVKPIQPKKPADVPALPEKTDKKADKPA